MKINKIHSGDCVEMMSQLSDQSVDLIIADPPYNLGKDFGNDSDKWNKVDDWVDWSREWLTQSARVLKDSGAIFVYGIHHYQCFIQIELYKLNLKYRRQIIWHYENGFSGYKHSPSACYEPLLWFSKTDDYTYHTIREPYKSTQRLKNKITKNGKVWTPNPAGKMAGDVWSFPVLAGKRFSSEKVDHPTQKPLSITNRIIEHFSNPDDLVLVPFAGSGTECLAAKRLGRSYIGFEVNDQFVKLAESRIHDPEVLI
jgi:site-specific DNA-methyltransferase (adenine-specific)